MENFHVVIQKLKNKRIMTKKFWNDWQKRVGETDNIWLFSLYNGFKRNNWSIPLFSILNEFRNGDKLVKAEFHNDAVDLVIERHTTAWKNGQIHQVVQNEYMTLHREEISRITFKK